MFSIDFDHLLRNLDHLKVLEYLVLGNHFLPLIGLNELLLFPNFDNFFIEDSIENKEQG